MFLIEKEKEGIKAGGVGSKVYFYFKYLPLTIVLEDQRMQKNKAVEEDGYSGVIRGLRIKENRNYQNIIKKSDTESDYYDLLNFANRSFKYLKGFFDIQKDSNKEIIRKIRKEAVIAVPVIDTGNNINLEMDISFLEQDINLKIICESEEIFNFSGAGKRDLIFKTLDFIIPEKKFTYARNMINSCGSMINKSFYAREINYESFEENISDKTYEVFAVPGSSFMVKKDVIVETKLFDTKFFTYYEDIDFFWRARLKGWKFFTEPKSVVRHFHCGSGREWSYGFTYHVLKNRLLMIYKCGWPLSFLKSYLSFCATAFISLIYIIISKLKGVKTDRIDVPIRIRIFFEFFILMICRLAQRIKTRMSAKISDSEIKAWQENF